jgi:hypothetical protein
MAKQGGFFVRLCYGYVGKYKDTSKMTTKEVVEEFLKRKGVSSPREFFDKVFVENERQHKHLNKWTEPPPFGEQMSNYLGIDKFSATKITDAIISWSDGVYKQIRKAQQENNVTNPFYQKAKYLEEYIELAPKWKGKPIYRGMHLTQEQIDSFNVGEYKDMNGLSSWTSEELIANDFAEHNKKIGEQEVIFISKNGTNKGASITQLAHWEEEGEVLVSSEATYRVTNKYTKGKRTYIEVEEI